MQADTFDLGIALYPRTAGLQLPNPPPRQRENRFGLLLLRSRPYRIVNSGPSYAFHNLSRQARPSPTQSRHLRARSPHTADLKPSLRNPGPAAHGMPES